MSGTSQKWHGLIWGPISIDEMHCFLGILLQISLQPQDLGGYPSYFCDADYCVTLSKDPPKTFVMTGTKGFFSMVSKDFRMSLNRFKQIRGAFHPEDKVLGNDNTDKCYQLRKIINQLNVAANDNFVPEGNCSFDEGGTPCRSRYCPVRQVSFEILPSEAIQ